MDIFMMKLEETVKGILFAIFFAIILILMLFAHSLLGFVASCALLLAFILLCERME